MKDAGDSTKLMERFKFTALIAAALIVSPETANHRTPWQVVIAVQELSVAWFKIRSDIDADLPRPTCKVRKTLLLGGLGEAGGVGGGI